MSAPQNLHAFPFPAERNSWGDGIREGSDGMTLRDWFAGQAMAAILSLGADYTYQLNGLTAGQEAARDAYVMADAMLSARGDAV